MSALVCWFVAPVVLARGLLGYRAAIRDGRVPEPHAKRAVLFGALGSSLLLLSLVGKAIARWNAPKLVETPAAALDREASTSPSTSTATVVDSEQENARAHAVLEAARKLSAARGELEAKLGAVTNALAGRNLSAARKGIDELDARFVRLDRAYLLPDDRTAPADRDALTSAAGLYTRFEELQKSVEQSETAVFRAAFDALWAPQNAGKEEEQLLASVG